MIKTNKRKMPVDLQYCFDEHEYEMSPVYNCYDSNIFSIAMINIPIEITCKFYISSTIKQVKWTRAKIKGDGSILGIINSYRYYNYNL